MLCSLRAVLVFYLQKISAKTGLALPSGELIANMESIEFSMGIQWEFPLRIPMGMGAAAGFYRKGTIPIL